MSSPNERRRHRRSLNKASTAPGWRGVVERYSDSAVFCILCLMLVFAALALGAIHPWSRATLGLLTLVALLCWAARVAVAGKLMWIRTPLDLPLAVGAAYVVALYAVSPVEWISRQEMLLVLTYASVYFLVTQHCFRSQRQHVLLWLLMTLAVGITAYGIINRLRGVDMVWWIPYEDIFHRVRGTFRNPNHFAGFLELTLAVALAHLLWSGRGAAQRIVLAYAACVMFVGIAFSGSRGGYISTGGMLVFVVAAVARGVTRRWWPALVIVLLGLLAGAWGIYGFEALRTRFFSPQMGRVDTSRMWMWQAAWQIFLEHPWFGTGPCMFNAVYGRYRDPLDQFIPEYVHNDYLQTLCDYGITGFVLMGLLVGAFLVTAWRIHLRWRQRGIGEHSGWHWPYWLDTDRVSRPAWLLGSAAAVVVYMLHSAVDFNLHISANALTLTVLMAMGMLAGHARRLTENLPDGVKPLPPVTQSIDTTVAARRMIAGAIAVLVAAEATVAVPNGVSCAWQWLAEKRYERAEFAQARDAAEQAWAWDSRNHHIALLLGDMALNEALLSSKDATASAEQALQWYQRAGKLDPIEAEPVSRQAQALEHLKRWKEAEAGHMRALSISPNYYLYYERLGLFHAARGEKEKAAAELRTRVTLNRRPESTRLLFERRIRELTAPAPPAR
ncbi:MAG: O-antigen ligase family protein [Verrucomicrobia bacterium]|nr:O-antigen ligase family protein [Verrucomicrobiota bacterium]